MGYKLPILTRKHKADELHKSTDRSATVNNTKMTNNVDNKQTHCQKDIIISKKYRENNKTNDTFKPKSNKQFGSSRKMILIKKKVISENDDYSVATTSTVSLSSLESTSSLDSSFSDDSVASQAQIIIEEGLNEKSNKN